MIALVLRLGQGLASRWRNLLLRLLGADLRTYCWLRKIEVPRQWSDLLLHGCSLDRGVTLICSGPPNAGKIEIGHGAYLNRHTIVDAHEKIFIGRDAMLGPFCYITDANHGLRQEQSVKSQPMTTKPVRIEDEAWLGARVTVLPGVTIGRGAIIGAGSIVTTDIPADAIAVGSPAVVKRYRPGPVSEQ